MTFNQFTKEVHQNAVDHGWYDPEPNIHEIFALIHSEWSEALEEYRDDRPMVWHACMDCGEICKLPCDHASAPDRCDMNMRDPKPEGIAVELLDGCLRVLDFIGYSIYLEPDEDFDSIICATDESPETRESMKRQSMPEFVSMLHMMTARAQIAILMNNGNAKEAVPHLMMILICTFAWLEVNGIEDPKELMLQKHEYNKKRPYKHGKVI